MADQHRDLVMADLDQVVRGIGVSDEVALLLGVREGLPGPAYDLAVTGPHDEGCLAVGPTMVVRRSEIDPDDEVVSDRADRHEERACQQPRHLIGGDVDEGLEVPWLGLPAVAAGLTRGQPDLEEAGWGQQVSDSRRPMRKLVACGLEQ